MRCEFIIDLFSGQKIKKFETELTAVVLRKIVTNRNTNTEGKNNDLSEAFCLTLCVSLIYFRAVSVMLTSLVEMYLDLIIGLLSRSMCNADVIC